MTHPTEPANAAAPFHIGQRVMIYYLADAWRGGYGTIEALSNDGYADIRSEWNPEIVASHQSIILFDDASDLTTYPPYKPRVESEPSSAKSEVIYSEQQVGIEGLRACPFCGGNGYGFKVLRDGYQNYQEDQDAYAYAVRCRSCAAEGGWKKTREGARNMWNMRTSIEVNNDR